MDVIYRVELAVFHVIYLLFSDARALQKHIHTPCVNLYSGSSDVTAPCHRVPRVLPVFTYRLYMFEQ